MRARFFLHRLTADGHRPAVNDGDLDMDFNFDSRGVMANERCVAVASVPSSVLRVRTGQVSDDGILWEVEL